MQGTFDNRLRSEKDLAPRIHVKRQRGIHERDQSAKSFFRTRQNGVQQPRVFLVLTDETLADEGSMILAGRTAPISQKTLWQYFTVQTTVCQRNTRWRPQIQCLVGALPASAAAAHLRMAKILFLAKWNRRIIQHGTRMLPCHLLLP